MHFNQMWRLNPSKTRQQFEDKFRKTETCWLWVGALNPRGYGWFKQLNSHRCAWMIYREEIPKGMFVLHKCDNTSCVNPDHLFLGTQNDNMKDMDEKGRRITPDRRGKMNGRCKLSESDVFAIRLSSASPMFLAKWFDISDSQVRAIQSGRGWKHLQEASRG